MISTSYTEKQRNLLTSLTNAVDPAIAVEIGAQQGASAVAIARGMGTGSFHVVDLFEENYADPPFANTHASIDIVREVLTGFPLSLSILKRDGLDHLLHLFWAHMDGWYGVPDLVHIDICNHYDNLKPILQFLASWKSFKGTVLLEGGRENSWQRKHNFKPYTELLFEGWFVEKFTHVTIPFDEDHGLTIVRPV